MAARCRFQVVILLYISMTVPLRACFGVEIKLWSFGFFVDLVCLEALPLPTAADFGPRPDRFRLRLPALHFGRLSRCASSEPLSRCASSERLLRCVSVALCFV